MRSGFTLLETLIALVIAALVTLVLMDSLAAATGHAARLEEANRTQTARVLALVPILRAMKGAVPDYHDGDAVFTGEARRLRGLTLSPAGFGAGGVSGAPEMFEITLEADGQETRLVYREHGHNLIEVTLPEDVRLAYIDASGARHDVWPPPEGFDPDPIHYRPVPAAVMILRGEIPLLAAAPARSTGITLRVQDYELVL